MAHVSIGAEVVISGKVIEIDIETNTCWIRLTHENDPTLRKEAQYTSIVVPEKYLKFKRQFVKQHSIPALTNKPFSNKPLPTLADSDTSEFYSMKEFKITSNNSIKPVSTTSNSTEIMPTFFQNANAIDRKSVLNSWLKVTGCNGDSKTMEIESNQNCEAWFLKACPQTQRILFLLQHYQEWIDFKSDKCKQSMSHYKDSITDALKQLKGYSYHQTWNDFHHLSEYHFNVSDYDKGDDICQYFKKELKLSAAAHLHKTCKENKCLSFRRNIRDREKCHNSVYRRDLYFVEINDDYEYMKEIAEMNSQNFLDTIHSALLHYDLKTMILNDKFITDVIDCDEYKYNNDDLKEEDRYFIDAVSGFGMQYSYWNDKSSTYCKHKYDSFKQELLRNKLYGLKEFEYMMLMDAATHFLKTNKGRNMVANKNGLWNKICKIKANTVIGLEHIVALMSYANYEKMSKKFKRTYEKYRNNERRDELNLMHQEIAIWARLLTECILLFSDKMKDGLQLYHGIDARIRFSKVYANVYGPCSCTSMKQTAYNYAVDAKHKGVVLTLSKANSKKPYVINLTFLSDYPKEEGHISFMSTWAFSNIIYNGISTKLYCKCLMLFQKIIDGHFVVYDSNLFQITYQNVLIMMMNNYMNISRDKMSVSDQLMNDEIPTHIQKLFNIICSTMKYIWLNGDEFKLFSKDIQKYFMVHQRKHIFKNRHKKIKYGLLTSYLLKSGKLRFKDIMYPTYLEWKIMHTDLKMFWNNKFIESKNIKCSLGHILMKSKSEKHNNITLYIRISKHSTLKLNDGQFKISVYLKSMPSIISRFEYEYQFMIPELNNYNIYGFHESIGGGLYEYNLFQSDKLRAFVQSNEGFTIKCMIKIISCKDKIGNDINVSYRQRSCTQ